MKKLIYFVIIFVLTAGIKSQAQTLLPGDGIKIIFYNISDSISGEYFIQDNGNVSLPYLGQIAAANRSIDSIRTEIYAKYSKLYKNPEITVLPLIKINILGEVRNPGFYYVTGVEKLSDLIAKAGGTNVEADLSNIYITRKDKEFEINGQKIIEKGSKLNDIGLQSGDQIYISRKWLNGSNTTIIISVVSAVTSILAAIIYTNRK